MRRLLTCLLLAATVFSSPMAYAREFEHWSSWSESDRVKFAVATAFTVVDWGQTRWIAANPDSGYYETNPFIGRHPSIGRVNTHFAMSLLALYGVSGYFPQYRSSVLNAWIALEVVNTARNHYIGIRIHF